MGGGLSFKLPTKIDFYDGETGKCLAMDALIGSFTLARQKDVVSDSASRVNDKENAHDSGDGDLLLLTVSIERRRRKAEWFGLDACVIGMKSRKAINSSFLLGGM